MNTCGIFIVSAKDTAAYSPGTVRDLSTTITSLMEAGVVHISLSGFEAKILSSLSISHENYLHSRSSSTINNYRWIRLNGMVDQDEIEHGILLENLQISSDQLASLLEVHDSCRTGITLGLTSVISKDSRIYSVNGRAQIAFSDVTGAFKSWCSSGVVILDKSEMLHNGIYPPFTKRTNILDRAVSEGRVSGCPLDSKAMFDLRRIDPSWTLFLDRDGVINTRIPGSYVKHPDEFEFMDGVPDALQMLRPLFSRIVIVTNQQGIDKQAMTRTELSKVHQRMNDILHKNGVSLDAIYFCPGLEKDKPICRKPLPGMALQAVEQFPDIDFSRSIMVGDSHSDIVFGNRLGMITVKVGDPCRVEDYVLDSLSDLPSLLAGSFK